MIILRQKVYSKKTSTVYLLVGLPGSGKSTWCKKEHPNLPVISRDIIRYKLGYTSGPDEKARLTEAQEELITKEEYKCINKYLKSGSDFIIDDTNLKKKYRTPLIKLLKDSSAHIIGVNFRTPLSICIKRRKYKIDPEIMKNIYETMDKIGEQEVDELINVN